MATFGLRMGEIVEVTGCASARLEVAREGAGGTGRVFSRRPPTGR